MSYSSKLVIRVKILNTKNGLQKTVKFTENLSMQVERDFSFSNRLEVSAAAKIALRPVIVVRVKTVTSIFKRLIQLGVNPVTVIQPAHSMETLSVTLQKASATARLMSEVSFRRNI